RRAHIVNLFIWPASNGEARTTATTHNGYNVIRWQQDGMTFCAVSDLNATELRDLQNDYMASISH
ncbi:MAG TPA: hypothetical protein VET48_14510, partial [Steroidobacteraceae bacterium]|nr:hypothetical protein [Steroidobacteraceae bacterium]